ncbi:hypothetical protein RYA05_02735 [Pseudomonas syringae pv. actinidiae]|nr:hypothetical protein [Pseudomonas syringae pv. actinidiae]
MNAVNVVFRSSKGAFNWMFSLPKPNLRHITYHGSAWALVFASALLALLIAHG